MTSLNEGALTFSDLAVQASIQIQTNEPPVICCELENRLLILERLALNRTFFELAKTTTATWREMNEVVICSVQENMTMTSWTGC